MGRRVKVIYFKTSGKYYTSVEYDSGGFFDFFDIIGQFLKMRREGRQPGLFEGCVEFHALLEIQINDAGDTLPHLILEEGIMYTKSILHKCQDCQKKATVELFNDKNASYGYFCKTCAAKRMQVLEKERLERTGFRGKATKRS